MLEMRPVRSTGNAKRGYLIPIGGAEDKETNPVILQHFVDLCGGAEANIVVFPTASRLEDTGARYVDIFKRLGAGKVDFINLETRADCENLDNLKRLDEATGIFITGGNQLRLSTIIGGTPLGNQIRYLNAHEVHVAGTSAGAAILPEHMIAGGETGPTPRQAAVTLSPGLALTNRLVIDQHFRQRDRLGRLLTALAYNPYFIGLGIDEDTAAFISPEGLMEIGGSGGVTIVDPSDLEYSSIAETRRDDVVTMTNVRIHILAAGDRFDLRSRRALVRAHLEAEENA